MDNTQVIIRPIITEKSMRQADNGRYTFEVAKHAAKPQIKQVIEKQFEVKVIAVSTMIQKGRTHRMGRKTRVIGKTSSIKKAIVQVAKGQKIGIFEVAK